MNTPPSPSPMLKAIDLVRVNIDDMMEVQDLEGHAAEVLDTIAALNDYINKNGGNRSSELLNAQHQARKLCLHMAHVRDLIHAHQAALALAGAAQAAGSANLAQGAKLFGI